MSPVSLSAPPIADGIVVILPARELDLLTCPALHRDLTEQLDCGSCGVLIVDFTRVEFLSAAAMGVLVDVRDRAELAGVELRLVISSPQVWRPLRITGLADKFDIYANLAQALTGHHLACSGEGQ